MRLCNLVLFKGGFCTVSLQGTRLGFTVPVPAEPRISILTTLLLVKFFFFHVILLFNYYIIILHSIITFLTF